MKLPSTLLMIMIAAFVWLNQAETWTAPRAAQPCNCELHRTIMLSPDQLRAFNTVPVEIVPAPGPGFAIIPSRAIWYAKSGTMPYTSASGGAAVVLAWVPGIFSGNFSDYYWPFNDGPFATDFAASMLVIETDHTGGVVFAPPEYVENAALVIGNRSDDGLRGSGDGTLTVTVYYTVEALQ